MTCQNVSEFFMLHIKYSRLGGLLFIRDIALNSLAPQHIIEPDIDQEQKIAIAQIPKQKMRHSSRVIEAYKIHSFHYSLFRTFELL